MGKSEDDIDNKTSVVKGVAEKTLKSDDRSQELSNVGKIITSLAAGGIAGGIAKTVIAPLDRWEDQRFGFNIDFFTLGQRFSFKQMRQKTTDFDMLYGGSNMAIEQRGCFLCGEAILPPWPGSCPTRPSTSCPSSSTRSC